MNHSYQSFNGLVSSVGERRSAEREVAGSNPSRTIPTRVSLEIVSAQDPMLDFSIVLVTEKNPNLDRVDVIE